MSDFRYIEVSNVFFPPFPGHLHVFCADNERKLRCVNYRTRSRYRFCIDIDSDIDTMLGRLVLLLFVLLYILRLLLLQLLVAAVRHRTPATRSCSTYKQQSL